MICRHNSVLVSKARSLQQSQDGSLFEVRRLLATVANNVNQLARSANVSGEVAVGERLERTLVEVDELLLRIRALTGARR